MFFRKSRAAKKAEAEKTRQAILDGFEKAYEDAQASMDPADRILRLQDMKEAIDALTGNSKIEINEESKKKFFTTYMGVGLGTTIAATVAAVSLAFPPALIIFMGFPGIIAGRLMGEKSVLKAREKMMKENKPFFDALDAFKGKADAAIESAKNADMRVLAKSERFPELMERVPSLREKFAEAYRRATGEGDFSGKPKPKKPDDNGLHF